MTLGYSRKSNNSLAETTKIILEMIDDSGWKLIGQDELPDKKGAIIVFCESNLLKKIISEDDNLLALLPCSISVFQKQDSVVISSGQVSLIKALSQNQVIINEVGLMEDKIKNIIHRAGNITPLKPKSVKLYSTLSCPYCKMEKAWLEEKKIEHKVIYVDQDQVAAKEMVNKTGQMGVPVSEIEYDDAESQYVIGFDRPKLIELLDLKDK